MSFSLGFEVNRATDVASIACRPRIYENEIETAGISGIRVKPLCDDRIQGKLPSGRMAKYSIEKRLLPRVSAKLTGHTGQISKF